MNKTIAIITLCFNENVTIVEYLKNLDDVLCKFSFNFIIIVVDDASTDNTLEMLKKYRPNSENLNLTILTLKFNLGLQQAIYQGLLYAHKLSPDKFIVKGSEGQSIYPDALGVKVENEERKDIIGIAFLSGIYKYGSVRTNCELFISRKGSNQWLITYKNGSFFEVNFLRKPAELKINNHILKENVDWKYIDRRLRIELPKGTGEICIN